MLLFFFHSHHGQQQLIKGTMYVHHMAGFCERHSLVSGIIHGIFDALYEGVYYFSCHCFSFSWSLDTAIASCTQASHPSICCLQMQYRTGVRRPGYEAKMQLQKPLRLHPCTAQNCTCMSHSFCRLCTHVGLDQIC